MYNLFVVSDTTAWDGDPHKISADRCLRSGEYTDSDSADRYVSLSRDDVAELRRFPCVFAYENSRRKNPLFGFLTDVCVLQGEVRIEYELIPIEGFLTFSQLEEIHDRLDIKNFELNRTHWAVKKVDLYRKLRSIGIPLPRRPIDIDTHQFDVALSFPGSFREYVTTIADHLRATLGPDRCFFDEHYKAQLARPGLNFLLQEIYGDRSRLIVVFLGHDYQHSEWCGIEFRAVCDILKARDRSKIMYIRMDDGAVEGVLETDGYLDARQYDPEDVAQFIHQRIRDSE